jgi:hypothetical protein
LQKELTVKDLDKERTAFGRERRPRKR